MKLISVLGRQPKLSLAELISLFGESVKLHAADTAVYDGELNPHLGGSLKTGEVIHTLTAPTWENISKYLFNNWQDILPHTANGKFNLGISVYGPSINGYQKTCFTLKRLLKKAGVKTRIVLPEKQQLSSAQVLHNDLVENSVEIIISIGAKNAVIARTKWVQDIESYSHRDYDRPCRDMKVGMLPPKLAQIMLNLTPGHTVYDPFCGSGVVLQEALLSSKTAYGSDISKDMVDCSSKNLEWLMSEYNLAKNWQIFEADARSVKIPDGVDSIVSEGYLGPLLDRQPSREQLDKLAKAADELILKTLENLNPQLKAGTGLCLAVPAWVLATALSLHQWLTPLIFRGTIEYVLLLSRRLIYYIGDQINWWAGNY